MKIFKLVNEYHNKGLGQLVDKLSELGLGIGDTILLVSASFGKKVYLLDTEFALLLY